MTGKSAVLEFTDVTLPAGNEYDLGLSSANLRVGAGELALVLVDPQHGRVPIADAAEGLLEPQSGAVLFLGRDWRHMDPDHASACRARIGRVFHGPAWISNLDVDENITLKERHHSRRPWEEIRREALSLAQAFGFHDLPCKRPGWMSREELYRAQWVRALLGHPTFLLLEFPERDAADATISTATDAVRRSLDHGACALCVTSLPQLWRDHGLKVASKYRIVDSGLTPMEPDA